jgi:hypothetical protein
MVTLAACNGDLPVSVLSLTTFVNKSQLEIKHRLVPAWNFQLCDMTRSLHLIVPGWPKSKLGDLHAGFRPYAEAGSTALAAIPLQTLKPAIWFSNAEACHQILEYHDTKFRKDMISVSY